MSTGTGIKISTSFLTQLESQILTLLSKEEATELEKESKDICHTLVSASTQCSNREDLENVQYLCFLFLGTINSSTPLSGSKELADRVVPITNFQYLNCPVEIHLDHLKLLPVPQLVRMREVNRYFRDLVDSSFQLQTRIAHHYLTVMQHKSNIPIDDIRYSLKNDSLALEIKGDLGVHHLSRELARVVPWISNLIVKGCKPDQLKVLLTQLKDSQRLTTLYLRDCQVDADCVRLLQDLQKNGKQEYRVPVIYLCNVENRDTDSPMTLPLNSHEKIKIIASADASVYSLERFQGDEADLNVLSEFERQVSNYQVKTNNVLEIFDSMSYVLKTEIISAIWHGILMDPTSESTVPTSRISHRVRSYIAEYPHHPSLISAARSFRDEFQEKIRSASASESSHTS